MRECISDVRASFGVETNSFSIVMDYSASVEPFLGQDPTSLRDVALERIFPLETLQSIASRPDVYGFQRIGETATDKDFIPKQDLRLKTRILMDAVGPPEDPSDKTWWVVPCVLYRGLPEFSVTELVVPCTVLKRCTATSELDAMGMYKLCRSYTPQMYGGAIDVSAELLQRARNVEDLEDMFHMKVEQLVRSLQMTFRNIIYGHMFAGPPLEYTEMRKIYTDSISKRDLFFGRFQKRIDNFVCWNFRQTDPSALLIDLDNSLKFDITIGGKGAADTFIMHPIMMNRLMDRLLSVDFDKWKRQVYYKCTNYHKKELEKKDIFNELTGATKNDAPNFAIVVSGDYRFVVPTPSISVDDERTNPAELDAYFKSFVVIGTNPTRSTLQGSLDIQHVQGIDWNTIWVTDLDRGVDAIVKLLDVMVSGGYFHEETYNPDVYNSMLESSHALVELRNEIPAGAFYDDLDAGYDTRKRTVLLRPSRKVYFDPLQRCFLSAFAYGHSDVCTSSISGDILAAMTLMRETQFDDDAFELESTYLRACMKLEWTDADRGILKRFYDVDFADLMNADGEECGTTVRRELLEDVTKNDGYTRFVNYDQLTVIVDVLQKAIEEAQLSGAPKDRIDVLTKACITINRILDFVAALANAYSRLVAGDEGYAHTLLYTSFGKNTLQQLFKGMNWDDDDGDFSSLQRNAILYHRIVLRLLCPSIVSVFSDPIVTNVDNESFNESVGHANIKKSG